MFDVLIIGGGVIGAMIAREISFYKLNTIVIEKENDFSPQVRRNEQENISPVRIEKDSDLQNFRWEIPKTTGYSYHSLLANIYIFLLIHEIFLLL